MCTRILHREHTILTSPELVCHYRAASRSNNLTRLVVSLGAALLVLSKGFTDADGAYRI